jgi:hypothetical protein
VRLFDGRNYTGAATGLLCAPAGADGLFADLGAMFNRASSMRVCPASVPSGCNAAAAPPPPAPAPVANGSPASPLARLSATLTRGRVRREVGFGHGATVRIRLVDEAGRPIAGAALQVLTREVRSGSEWRLDVRAGVTLKIRPRHPRAGRTMRLRGGLLAAPATRLGKVITLQPASAAAGAISRAPARAAAGASTRATASRAARVAPSRSARSRAPMRPTRTRPVARGAVRVRVG